ncbi:MAG TPA: aminotransferase class I/II-fold pyridoxal phosphate-dependent enzyme [Planctomycetota bacterium]|nr:aminotransferase class I/II-fold pyridoxal phosphate-dependent enzyme [Planctomycetota bacterium]
MPHLRTASQIAPNTNPLVIQHHQAQAHAAALEGMPSVNSPRMALLPPYLASRINAFNDGLRAKGMDVIDLGMGNPIDPIAENVVEKLKEAVDDPASHRYAPATGIRPIKEALARHYERHFNVMLNPEREVISSIGSKDAFSHLCFALLGNQDACVVPTPAYAPHYFAPQIAGAVVVGVFMDEEQPGDKLLEDIRNVFEVVRPRPKFLVMNFPHNPTARTVDLDFFEEIVEMARHFKFWVLNDLAYGHSCFDGYKAPSILQAKGARDVAVEMFTMSKPYSMAGWRVGFLAGNSLLVESLTKIKPYFDYGHFQAIQTAAAVALDTGDEYIKQQALRYQKRRDTLLHGLEHNGWGRAIKNRATMFSWQALPANFREMGTMEFCLKLAEHAGVSFFPGGGFGPEGEGFVRIALVDTEARIAEACGRIGKFLKQG